MKKVILVLGVLAIAFIVLNFIDIKSNFSYPVSNSAQINVKSNIGNLNFISSTSKSVVSGYLNRKVLSSSGLSFSANTLDLDKNRVNGVIALPNDVTFSEISIKLGAGNLDLNLKKTNVTKFYVNSGASNVRLVLPQDVSSKFDISVGSGNMNLVIPTNGKLDGVKIISPSLSNLNLGELWIKVADGIETKDFNKAKITSIVDLSKGGSVNLDINAEK